MVMARTDAEKGKRVENVYMYMLSSSWKVCEVEVADD